MIKHGGVFGEKAHAGHSTWTESSQHMSEQGSLGAVAGRLYVQGLYRGGGACRAKASQRASTYQIRAGRTCWGCERDGEGSAEALKGVKE